MEGTHKVGPHFVKCECLIRSFNVLTKHSILEAEQFSGLRAQGKAFRNSERSNSVKNSDAPVIMIRSVKCKSNESFTHLTVNVSPSQSARTRPRASGLHQGANSSLSLAVSDRIGIKIRTADGLLGDSPSGLSVLPSFW